MPRSLVMLSVCVAASACMLLLALVAAAVPRHAEARSAAGSVASSIPPLSATATRASPKLDLTTPPPRFTLEAVPHRFIVGFRTYAEWRVHEQTLRALWDRQPQLVTPEDFALEWCSSRWNMTTQCSARQQMGVLDWRTIVRNNPGSAMPTDFLLIHFDAQPTHAVHTRINEALENLQHANRDVLKYVMAEKRVTRSLMSIVDEELTVETEDEAELPPTQRKRAAKTTADDCEADYTLESESLLPHTPQPGGVGDFPPPQRFDLGRGSVESDVTPPSSAPRRKLCQWSNGGGNSPTDLLKASKLWDKGFRGGGIRIAIFDTGLSKTHPHFAHVDERTNWTDEQTLEDGLGHGTFVAGVIAAGRDCLGFAPDASLHVFRVFNQRQLSFTSWFLDAFNYAIHSRVHVLNLSIGGPDFLDRPFVEKVNEMSANGITVVSAIGNDGPLWGTLNNPADQMDVIGVGGINEDHKISAFSSRGMTTAELPNGYGRMKPDLVALARNIRGSNQGNGCKTMSGTSVASPVVAGCVTLLASVVPADQRSQKLNPAFMKQLLLESSVRLPKGGPNGPGIFEQGEGAISLENAFAMLTDARQPFDTHASIIPSKLDLMDCPYMWPYCSQPIYFTAMPTMLNLTVLNSQAVASFVPTAAPPRFHPADPASREFLRVRFTHADTFWPWSGWFGVHLTLAADVPSPMTLSGWVEITVDTADEFQRRSVVKMPLKIQAIPQPPREKRLLFDVFHNLRYPSGYFPRDNLEVKMDTLDWNGDHIHTNYRELYTALREGGYYVEVLGRDYTCFDASHYGTLVLVDPEEEFFVEEVHKLQDDVYLEGLHLLVLADWYNTRVMREIKFYDENTAEWWTPETGGSNIPALNSLLAGFGVQLTDHVLKGEIKIAGEGVYYASGTSIGQFPASGTLFAHHLLDAGSGAPAREYNIMGVYEPASTASPLAAQYPSAGRLFVYGDSNCVDMNHRRGNLCGSLILDALKFLHTGDKSRLFKNDAVPLAMPYVDATVVRKPRRATGNNLIKYSKITSAGSAPQCPVIGVETASQAAEAASDGPLTVVSVYEQQHSALRLAAGPAVSADEVKANSRFGHHSTIKKIKKKRRLTTPVTGDDEDPPLAPSTKTRSADPNKPQPVLAKQARLNPSLGDTDGLETAQLFAASPAEALALKLAMDARKEARIFWMKLVLACVVLCLLLVVWLYRKQLAPPVPLVGKLSPVNTPTMGPRLPLLQPRPLSL